MTNKKIVVIGIAVSFLLVVGYFSGSAIGKYMVEQRKVYTSVKDVRDFKIEPYGLAKSVNFSIDREEMPEVIEQLDYNTINSNKPTIVYVRKPLSVMSDSNKNRYQLDGHKFYKVVDYSNDEYIKITAPTNKDGNLEFKVKKEDVVVVDSGKWLKVKFKSGNIAWMKQLKQI